MGNCNFRAEAEKESFQGKPHNSQGSIPLFNLHSACYYFNWLLFNIFSWFSCE